MNVNKAIQSMDQRLPNELAQITREQNALKTRQLLGGDNIVIANSTEALASFSLVTGQAHNIRLTLSTPTPVSNLFPICHWSLYVGQDNDLNYLWPIGPILGMPVVAGVTAQMHHDLVSSDPANGIHVFILNVINNTGSTFTFYFHAVSYFPKVQL